MHVLLVRTFNTVLSCTNKTFDIVAITEIRITKNIFMLNNLNIKNYFIEFTPTGSSAGGTLLYIANHLSYKPCQDLNIYKKNELESTFIEIMNPKNQTLLVSYMNIPQWMLLILIVITQTIFLRKYQKNKNLFFNEVILTLTY